MIVAKTMPFAYGNLAYFVHHTYFSVTHVEKVQARHCLINRPFVLVEHNL